MSSQVQNGGRVFAAAETTKKGSKSQIGRWKGLDEDVSDDQVHLPSLTYTVLRRAACLPQFGREFVQRTTWSLCSKLPLLAQTVQ